MLMSHDMAPTSFINDTSVYLTKNNTAYFYGEITPMSVDAFSYAIAGRRMFLPPKETLYILINSVGGDFDMSLLLIKNFDAMKNVKLICRNCASGAGILFAESKHPRLAIKNSSFIMHEAYIQHVTAADIYSKTRINEFLDNSSEFNKMLYSIIGMSKKEYESKILDTAWIVKGVELVALHLADKFVTITCDEYVKQISPSTCEQ